MTVVRIEEECCLVCSGVASVVGDVHSAVGGMYGDEKGSS